MLTAGLPDIFKFLSFSYCLMMSLLSGHNISRRLPECFRWWHFSASNFNVETSYALRFPLRTGHDAGISFHIYDFAKLHRPLRDILGEAALNILEFSHLTILYFKMPTTIYHSTPFYATMRYTSPRRLFLTPFSLRFPEFIYFDEAAWFYRKSTLTSHLRYLMLKTACHSACTRWASLRISQADAANSARETCWRWFVAFSRHAGSPLSPRAFYLISPSLLLYYRRRSYSTASRCQHLCRIFAAWCRDRRRRYFDGEYMKDDTRRASDTNTRPPDWFFLAADFRGRYFLCWPSPRKEIAIISPGMIILQRLLFTIAILRNL